MKRKLATLQLLLTTRDPLLQPYTATHERILFRQAEASANRLVVLKDDNNNNEKSNSLLHLGSSPDTNIHLKIGIKPLSRVLK